MDEFFSSDKKADSTSDGAGKNKYLEADYFDENFSLKFRKGVGNAQSFQQNQSEDDDLFSSFVSEDFEENSFNSMPASSSEYNNTVRMPSSVVTSALMNDPRRTPVGRPVRAQNLQPDYSKPRPAYSGSENKKRGKKKSVAAIVISLVVAVIVAVVGGTVYYIHNRLDTMLNSVNYDTTIEKDRYLPEDAPVSEDIINILLIGSDARAEVSGQRSDTMILFTVDTASKQIKLTSFMRDSYVYIPCLERWGKMNSAYSNDGAQGVIDTIEYNFGIDVHNYVSVDFEGFEKIIDLLGGVTISGVTKKEARYMNYQGGVEVSEGTNHMNGYEALWYCRIRKLDSDFYRTQRQRKVISAVIDGAKESDISELMEILESALPYISTDLTKDEITSLVTRAVNWTTYEMVEMRIPVDGECWDDNKNGSYVLSMNIENNKAILKQFVYEKVVDEGETQQQDIQ